MECQRNYAFSCFLTQTSHYTFSLYLLLDQHLDAPATLVGKFLNGSSLQSLATPRKHVRVMYTPLNSNIA